MYTLLEYTYQCIRAMKFKLTKKFVLNLVYSVHLAITMLVLQM